MLFLYSFFLFLAQPLLWLYLKYRIHRGKEDAARIKERYGIASQLRPEGKLLWCHAASVGESLTLIPLIQSIKNENANINILVTTGTLTSARLIKNRLNDQIIHQFVPLDVPTWVKRFGKHWRPDIALFIESELWPNLLIAAKRQGAICVLANARLSQKTFARWQFFPKLAKQILGCFDLILAQSEIDTDRYCQLGAQNVHTVGNLKFAMEKLPCDESKFVEFQNAIANRSVWLLASSHEGEDRIAVQVHQELKLNFPNLLTVIVPRHLERSDDIEKDIRFANLKSARRSKYQNVAQDTDIYLADTFAELGIFFRAIPIVCMGGSLVPSGGHNLIEPAQYGCALLYGVHMTSSPTIRDIFERAGAGQTVRNEQELAEAIRYLLQNEKERIRRGQIALSTAEQNHNVMDLALSYLRPIFSGAEKVKIQS